MTGGHSKFHTKGPNRMGGTGECARPLAHLWKLSPLGALGRRQTSNFQRQLIG